MNGFLNKNLKSYAKNWLLPVKYAEMQLKNAVRNQYTNLYAYAANNPIHYTDPDGRKVKNKETQELLEKVFNNKVFIPYPEKFLNKINDNIVQGRPSSRIYDFRYIGNNTDLQKQAADILKESAESDYEIVNSKGWIDSPTLTDVTEYWIITCDSESDEGGFIYNILVDIGDDGSIEYIEWMPITQEEMNE